MRAVRLGVLHEEGTAQQMSIQRYAPRVVTERQRGTAKNRVSVGLSVKIPNSSEKLHGR